MSTALPRSTRTARPQPRPSAGRAAGGRRAAKPLAVDAHTAHALPVRQPGAGRAAESIVTHAPTLSPVRPVR